MKMGYLKIGLPYLILVTMICIAIFAMPEVVAPDSMTGVRAFVKTQIQVQVPGKPSAIPVSDFKDSFTTTVMVNHNPVQFRVYQFFDTQNSKKNFRTLKYVRNYHLYLDSLSFDFPGHAYWRAWVPHEQVCIWQKNEWLVVIQSENKRSIHQFKKNFDTYFQ